MIYIIYHIVLNWTITLNELNLITFNILENNEIKDRKKNVNDFLLDIDQTVLSIRKIGDNIICLNLTRKDDFELICRLSGVRITLTDIEEKENSLRQYSIVETDFNVMDNLEKNPLGKIGNNNLEIYTKVIKINVGEEDIFWKKDDDMKVYTFNKNYQLIGCLTEKKSLLLLKYIGENNNKNEKENMYYIFDYNICQFIYSFKRYNEISLPKLLQKLNFDKIIDKQGFIMIDKDLNIFQYFYDENYENKVYCIHTIKPEERKKSQLSNIIKFIKKKSI